MCGRFEQKSAIQENSVHIGHYRTYISQIIVVFRGDFSFFKVKILNDLVFPNIFISVVHTVDPFIGRDLDSRVG